MLNHGQPQDLQHEYAHLQGVGCAHMHYRSEVESQRQTT